MPRNRTVRLAVLGSSVQRAAPSGFPSSRSSALRRRIIVGILVLASLVLITVSFRSSALDGVQSTGATVLKPFEVAADRVTRPFRDTVSWFHGLVTAKNENKKLRAQVAELTRQHILDETAIEQNAQLQAELDYQGPPSIADYTKHYTEVLANPQNDLDQSVTIAAGSADGIVNGALVIQPIGGPAGTGALIGTVSKVLAHVSRVMLLTDPQSGVTAMDLTDPSAVGIVRRGSGDSLILDRVPKQPTVRAGDTIITAGTIAGSQFASRYPRAIPIGTVSSQSNTDSNLFQLIQIKPLVDLTDVHSVAVLVPKPQK